MGKTSVYITPELEERIETSGLTVLQHIRRSVALSELESQEAMIRRVIREELGAAPAGGKPQARR